MPLIEKKKKKKDIQAIKKEVQGNNIEIIEITKESIKNVRNIRFEQIIFLQNINFTQTGFTLLLSIWLI